MYLLADAIWRRFPTVLGHDGAHLELHRRAGLPVHRGTVRPTTVTPPETRPFRPKGGWRGSAEPIRLAPNVDPADAIAPWPRVLLVEDDQANRKRINAILAEQGVTVIGE